MLHTEHHPHATNPYWVSLADPPRGWNSEADILREHARCRMGYFVIEHNVSVQEARERWRMIDTAPWRQKDQLFYKCHSAEDLDRMLCDAFEHRFTFGIRHGRGPTAVDNAIAWCRENVPRHTWCFQRPQVTPDGSARFWFKDLELFTEFRLINT